MQIAFQGLPRPPPDARGRLSDAPQTPKAATARLEGEPHGILVGRSRLGEADDTVLFALARHRQRTGATNPAAAEDAASTTVPPMIGSTKPTTNSAAIVITSSALPSTGSVPWRSLVKKHDLDNAQIVVRTDHTGDDTDDGERIEPSLDGRQEGVPLRPETRECGGMPASENIMIASTLASVRSVFAKPAKPEISSTFSLPRRTDST